MIVVKGLDDGKVKWLTYLVYILLTIMTGLTTWHTIILFQMPDKYVRLERYIQDNSNWLERYTKDQNRLEKNQEGMDRKLDEVLKTILQHTYQSSKNKGDYSEKDNYTK